jgi:hypothetical protein
MMEHILPEHMAEGQTATADPRQCSIDNQSGMKSTPFSTSDLLQASFFGHARDNQARPWAGSWDELRAILAKNYTPSPGNPGGTPKQSMPALSGAIYAPGATRGMESAQGVGLLILDVDNSREEQIPGEFYPNPRTGEPSNRPKMQKVQIGQPVNLDEVQSALQGTGLASMSWTTWSSSPAWPKIRAVVPLAGPVPVEVWERAADWALSHLGLDSIRRGIDLPVLHNACALAFLPGSPNPASIHRSETSGGLLHIPLESLPETPRTALADWQWAIVTERKKEREGGECWWMAYRVNGLPVDFQSVDLVSLLKSRSVITGREKPFKTGTKTRCHCPWAADHSNHRDGDDAVVIHTPGTWPSFRCEHSGHRHLGLRDLLEWAWGTP